METFFIPAYTFVQDGRKLLWTHRNPLHPGSSSEYCNRPAWPLCSYGGMQLWCKRGRGCASIWLGGFLPLAELVIFLHLRIFTLLRCLEQKGAKRVAN